MEQYYRHIRVLEEAFDSLKQASGLVDLHSVVTGIIKTTEQQASLYSHMNTLQAEIDSLEEALRFAARSMTRQRSLRDTTEQQAITIKQELSSQNESLELNIKNKENRLVKIREVLKNTFIGISVTLEQFEAREFQDIMVVNSHRDAQASRETIMSQLGELDACVTSLLTWLAYIQGQDPRPRPMVPPTKSYEALQPTIKEMLMTINGGEMESEEVRVPLKEGDFRNRARMALISQQSESTLASRRRTQTPH